jgi:hypothetical protein
MVTAVVVMVWPGAAFARMTENCGRDQEASPRLPGFTAGMAASSGGSASGW